MHRVEHLQTKTTLRPRTSPVRTSLRPLALIAFVALGVWAWTLLPSWMSPGPQAAAVEPAAAPPHPADLGLPAAPAPAWVAEGPPFCPPGSSDAGTFGLTAYALAQEREFDGELTQAPCGVTDDFPDDFLFGTGVAMQGSGRTADGRILAWRGECLVETGCARTASGECARPGHTVAVDPEFIPLGAEIWIDGLGNRVAQDTGGRIRGARIDLFWGDDIAGARAFGRRDARVCVLGS